MASTTADILAKLNSGKLPSEDLKTSEPLAGKENLVPTATSNNTAMKSLGVIPNDIAENKTFDMANFMSECLTKKNRFDPSPQ